MTSMFAAFGVTVIVWRATAKRLALLARALPARLSGSLAWLLSAQVLAWLAWLALSVLRTQRFPDVVEQLWSSRL
jgi:hypothetical protein